MSHALAPAGGREWWRGDDFPAWLSPMLVKELRQGIQSGAFAWTFVGLQVAMFLLMAWTTAWIDDTGSYTSAVRTMSGVFWAAVGVAMVMVVPLQGLGAVAAERAGNNLDLVRLTHLSATKIVTGKWLALVAQSLLLATAVLPYLVLRYFLGGVEVLHDLETFGWLAGASMLVAAAAIALSTLPQWQRIAACILIPSAAFAGAEALDDVGLLRMSVMTPFAKIGFLALIACYGVACLEFAAGRIAPAAENHAARKRLLALGLAAALVGVCGFGASKAAAAMFITVTPLVLAYAVGALVEQPTRITTVVAPFARAGWPGRVAARFLAPGWATGLLFVTLAWAAFAIAFLVAQWRFSHDRAEGLALGLTLAGLLAATLVFPLPLLVRLPRVSVPLLLYVLVHLVAFMVFVWSGAAWSGSRPWHESAWWPAVLPLPLAALLAYGAIGNPSEMARFAPVFGGAAAVMLAVVGMAVAGPWIREMRGLGRLLAAASAGRKE
jgi:hypothetical protein